MVTYVSKYYNILKWFSTISNFYWYFYEAIIRIVYPKQVESGLMLVIATIGLIVNIVLTVILMRSLKNEQNINVQSALWHFVGDLLNSVGVI